MSELEPYLNGPFTPDKATPISKMKEEAEKNGWPTKIEVGLIGSCTNSSYEDISRSASLAQQAVDKKLVSKSKIYGFKLILIFLLLLLNCFFCWRIIMITIVALISLCFFDAFAVEDVEHQAANEKPMFFRFKRYCKYFF